MARVGIPVAAILMPAGSFFSSMGSGRTSPSKRIVLVHLGARSLAVGLVALGIGMLTSENPSGAIRCISDAAGRFVPMTTPAGLPPWGSSVKAA